jgi:conjugal transfer mating pair stabilization protein TraN
MACIDNNCFDTSSPPNQDFALAATHLNVMKEASKDFDVDNLQIFKGRELGCSKAFLSYSDCCGDNGWGLDLEVTSCSDEEKELVQAARAESCHLVGSYCSNDNFFGICTSTRLEWCCFSSKLARIVNEQGRPQLAKGWGTPKSPDCSGFTPDELQQLDFAAMDLSEFYDDVMAQAKGMDVNQLSQTVTDRVTDYYETGTYSIPESQATSYDTSIAPPP